MKRMVNYFLLFNLMGCSTYQLPDVSSPLLIRQCFSTSILKVQMMIHYERGLSEAEMQEEYIRTDTDPLLSDFMSKAIDKIFTQNPSNLYQYTADEYVQCMHDLGINVDNKPIPGCLALTIPSMLAMKYRHMGKSRQEAIIEIDKHFSKVDVSYPHLISSINQWYDTEDTKTVDFLYTGFRACRKNHSIESVNENGVKQVQKLLN